MSAVVCRRPVLVLGAMVRMLAIVFMAVFARRVHTKLCRVVEGFRHRLMMHFAVTDFTEDYLS